MSRPSARIYIQIRETGEVFELEDFTSIDTDLNLYSTSTATVEIVNNLDKWYTFFSKSDTQKPETGVTPLLLNVHQSPRFREVNQKLASLTDQLYKIPDSVGRQRALGQVALINEYLVFDLMYRIWIDFRGREDLYDLRPSPPVGNLKERWYAGFTGIISSIDERFSAGKVKGITLNCKDMRRFFEVTQVVTNRGVYPLWNDLSSKLATFQAYTNSFSDYIDGAAIVYFVADLVNKIFHPGLTSEGKSKGLYSLGSKLTNDVFWNLPGFEQNIDAVREAQGTAQTANKNLAAARAQFSSAQQIASANPGDQQAKQQLTIAGDNLKKAMSNADSANSNAASSVAGVGKATINRTYEGVGNSPSDITPIRDVNGFAGMTPSSSFFSGPAANGGGFDPPSISGLTARNYKKSDLVNFITQQQIEHLGLSGSDKVATALDYLVSKFEVDRMISSGNTSGSTSTNPYQKLIQDGPLGIENQRTPASNILEALANYLNHNIWFDAKGNLIYQTARYDDFPNAQTTKTGVDAQGNETVISVSEGDYDDPNSNRGIPFISEGYDKSGKVVGYYNERHALDFTDGPVGLPFHGRNYIIGDESVVGWSVSQDESDVITALGIMENLQLTQSGGDPFFTRIVSTGQYTDPDLFRKFGPRYLIVPPMITSTIVGGDFLNILADGILRRKNHDLENLTLRLNCRPDLQIARTIYFAERRKLYYITRIQQHYEPSAPLDTVVTGQYGHLATDPIGDPISMLINFGMVPSVDGDFSIYDSSAAAEAPRLDLGESL